MADNVIAEPQQVQADVAQQPDFKAELDQMMAISLNGGIPPQAPEPQPVLPEAQNAPEPAQAHADTPQATDPFGLIKQKFGYESHEAAIKEIEELRAFKEQPRLPEFVFQSEDDARILKALAAGKRDELREFLNREAQIQQLVSGDVTKETAAQIVKLKMQLTNKDLTQQEIDYRYKKQFGVPPQPVRGMDEEDDEYNGRMAQWQEVVNDREMDLIIEAKMARPDIEKAKGQLSVPEIETPVDEGYAQYQKMLAQKAQDDAATRQAYKSLTAKAIETKLNFKDEANKIEFEFQFEPDAEGFTKAVETACDADLFWQTFTNSDGTPNRQKFLDAIYYANNKDKVIMSAINQGKNAAIKASLPDNSQSGLLIKQVTQNQEPNELDTQMRQSLRGYGGY